MPSCSRATGCMHTCIRSSSLLKTPRPRSSRTGAVTATGLPRRFEAATGAMHIVHTESSCGWGGQEIRVLEEAAGMQARGHRVTLLCPREAPIYAEAARRGVSAVALPIARKGVGGIGAMRAWLARNRSDVLNSHSSTDSWLAALALLGLNPRPALVRTRHISAAIPDNLATRWLYQSATRRIVTTGERLREQLIRDNRFRPESIVSVPTGIDLARYAPADRAQAKLRLGLDPEQACIGIVATLRSWKGHRYLMEAMAVGVPVVSSPVGSIDELVRHEETGLLVPPQDSDALRAAIERLLTEPELAQRLAREARARVLSRCSRERMLDSMEAVFREATA